MSGDRWNELEELMLQRTTLGLNPDEIGRLEELLAEAPPEDRDWIDRMLGELAAEIAVAEGEEALPEALRAALLASAPPAFEAPAAPPKLTLHDNVGDEPAAPATTALDPAASSGNSRGMAAWSGWLAAAAVLVIWLGSRSGVDSGTLTPDASPVDPMAAVLAIADRPDAVRREWTSTDDPTALGLSGGEVVWSAETQSGFMRFSGLAANSPSEFQYQLWIFDAERDERFPVDGGVFDIPADGGDVVIPINARLPVGQATLFAVTVESPGGVVVSDRSRIAALAQLG